MNIASLLAVLGLLLCLLTSGCADSGSSTSDSDKRGGFYGGVSGGGSWP